jgi:hypothetical protein
MTTLYTLQPMKNNELLIPIGSFAVSQNHLKSEVQVELQTLHDAEQSAKLTDLEITLLSEQLIH